MQSSTANTTRGTALALTLSPPTLLKLFCFPEREWDQTRGKHKKCVELLKLAVVEPPFGLHSTSKAIQSIRMRTLVQGYVSCPASEQAFRLPGLYTHLSVVSVSRGFQMFSFLLSSRTTKEISDFKKHISQNLELATDPARQDKVSSTTPALCEAEAVALCCTDQAHTKQFSASTRTLPRGFPPLRRMLLLRLQNQLLLCCGGPKKHRSDLGGSQATTNPHGSEDHLCQQSLRMGLP